MQALWSSDYQKCCTKSTAFEDMRSFSTEAREKKTKKKQQKHSTIIYCQTSDQSDDNEWA